MKILYISTPSFADCDFPLIREFQCKGLNITYLILLTPFSLRSTLIDIKKQIPHTGIFKATEYDEFKVFESYMDMSNVYVANRTAQKSYSPFYWKHKLDLYRFVKNGDFDIIHCDYLVGKGLKFLFGLTERWIQTIHDPFPHSGELTTLKANAYRITMGKAKFFVLLNEKQKDSFCNFYGINPDNVLINRLGVYDNIKSFIEPQHKIEENNILFFGRISPYKGIEYLCEAMKLVRKEIPNATLTIAGGGKMYFDINQYKALGYIEVLNYYISTKELARLLSRCELSVCPYTDATQSGVIMTSYALGKPVIATNVGGLPEMIDNGKSGIIVPPKNSTALANAIIMLLKDRDKLQDMTTFINNNYVHGERSWENITQKYINFYNKIYAFHQTTKSHHQRL